MQYIVKRKKKIEDRLLFCYYYVFMLEYFRNFHIGFLIKQVSKRLLTSYQQVSLILFIFIVSKKCRL